MSLSSYPEGFRGGVLLKEVAVYDEIDGNVFWVDSGAGLAGNPGTFLSPKSTILQAFTLCSANNNDVIFIKAGYTQTISAATEIVANVAGVSVIGLGRGTSRPFITYDNASSSIAVSAPDVTFQNFICHATAADVADAFTPTAKDCVVKDFLFSNGGSNLNWVELADTSTVDNEADGLTFERCHWVDPDLSTTSVVNVDADIDRLKIKDCYVRLGINSTLASLVEVVNGKNTTNIDLDGNFVNRLVTAAAIQLIQWGNTTTTNNGVSRNNLCATRDVADALYATAGSNVHQSGNLSTSAVDKSGFNENADS